VGLGIGHGVWRSGHSFAAGTGGSTSTLPGGPNQFPSGGQGGGSTGGQGGSNSNADLSAAASNVSKALVDINTVLGYADGEAAGTGIVITSSGYVLTNNHVISGATSIKATDVGNGQTYTATVVGYDRSHDVALIKLNKASGLTTAHIGDSSKVQTGEGVVGVGNAGGVGGTPSSAQGQVTALEQSITAQDEANGTSERLTGLIQTDCDIQPGDSGGALVDSNADVIGVDTAASTGFSFSTSGSQGFAVPINQAMSIIGLIRSGTGGTDIHLGETAFLGVGVSVNQAGTATSGAVVKNTLSGGPAAAAGIGAGDTITSLGGSPVTSPADLTNLIGHYHPGDRVSVQWTSANGSTHTATVTLAKGPAA
jgi:S1-C subfamily serine protease